MKALTELVSLLNRNKLKAIHIPGQEKDPDTKLDTLYDLIAKGTVRSDEEAQAVLYDDPADRNAYYKLKHTLKERLLDTVFLIDVKARKYSDIKQAQLECQKTIALYNSLIIKGARINAIRRARHGLRIAQQFEFTEEALYLSRKLRHFYALIAGDTTRFKYYNNLVQYYLQVFQAEEELEAKFYELLTFYIQNRSTQPEVAEITKGFLAELNELPAAMQTSNYVYFRTMLHVIQYMAINDYRSTVNICEPALQRLKQGKFLNTRAFIGIQMQYIISCIHLKLFEEGREAIQQGLAILNAEALAWFRYHDLYIMLCLHSGSNSEAFEVYHRSVINPMAEKMPTLFRETWRIYEAWFYFLAHSGRIDPKLKAREKLKDFRLGRYLNEVPVFSKDKRGLNIAILISQIVLLMQQKRYDRLIDHMDAIAKYRSRYLKDEYNYRSNIFIRMLMKVPQCNYNKRWLQEKVGKLEKLLAERPLETARQSSVVEILPYEYVWQIILSELR